MKMLPIVILAGGFGTRLGDITKDIPKSLVEINGIPFLQYQLELLKNNGFDKIYMSVGYKQEKIMSFVNKKDNIIFSTDNENAGTGGSIKNILGMINEENFFVTYGDSYLMTNYSAIQKKFFHSKKKSLMVIYKNKNKKDISNILYKKGIIEYNKEYNPKMEYIDYGLSIFNKKCFDLDSGKFDLSKIYNKMILEKEIASYIERKTFYEIGSVNGIRDFENYIKEKNNVR